MSHEVKRMGNELVARCECRACWTTDPDFVREVREMLNVK